MSSSKLCTRTCRRLRATGVVTASAATLLSSGVAGAGTTPASGPDDVQRSEPALQTAMTTRPATEALAPDKVRSFGDEMARMGRFYDTEDLVEHTIDDPLTGTITVVGPAGLDPVDVETAHIDEGDRQRTGMGVAMSGVTNESPALRCRRVRVHQRDQPVEHDLRQRQLRDAVLHAGVHGLQRPQAVDLLGEVEVELA